MTRAELLEVVYRFYPRGVPRHDPGYERTEQRRRLVEAARRGAAEYPTWKALIRRLGARHAVMDDSLFVLAGGVDPAYSAHLYLTTHTLGFHVCLLGPYYGVHRTGAAGEEPMAGEVVREIEAAYPGFQPIPPEIGDEVVPEVDWPLVKPTIHDCLLSEGWARHPFSVP
jgi:hypothetical protein